MLFSYGPGTFEQDDTRLSGEIVLSEHKLYLREGGEDLAASYVPLEKIERIRLAGGILSVRVRPSPTMDYEARFNGEKSSLRSLARDLASARGLTKTFWRKEWVDKDFAA